jgi:hypothetical protein
MILVPMTGIAIAAAGLGAVCFALAATLQHRVVGGAVDGAGRGLTPRLLYALATRPTWLAGLALSVAGGTLHLSAVALAPLPVVQPVGALAVPVAVLLAARAAGRRPSPPVLAGVGLTVTGVVAFVGLSAGDPGTRPVLLDGLPWTVAGTAAVVGGLAVVAAARPGWVRNAACAAAAAVAFGTETVLLRAVVRVGGQVEAPTAAVLLAGALVALLAGGWLVQQAFAAGPAEPVVAALTVLDPIVAVGLAAVLLGEGTPAPPAGLAAAALATAGVLTLARHHPDAAGRRSHVPGPRPVPERNPR